jgi:hypothetical protein
MDQHKPAFALLLALMGGVFVLGMDGRTVAETKDAPTTQELATHLLELQKRCDAADRQADGFRQQIVWLSRTSPPVGSVVAYAGAWPPKKGEGGLWTEDELGWILCDGRDITPPQFAELRTALGAANAPDYRGYFLRGLDTSGNVDKGNHQRWQPRHSRARHRRIRDDRLPS